VLAVSAIRYNHIIDHMPLQDLYEIDAEQRKRLDALTKIMLLEGQDNAALIQDVALDF